jgi:hypothetical protein
MNVFLPGEELAIRYGALAGYQAIVEEPSEVSGLVKVRLILPGRTSEQSFSHLVEHWRLERILPPLKSLQSFGGLTGSNRSE